MTPGPVDVRLRPGGMWLGGAVLSAVAGLAAIGGAGLLLFGEVNVIGALACLAIGAAMLALSRLYSRPRFDEPRLEVSADGITIHSAGLFRAPVWLPRHQVRVVYLRDHHDVLASLAWGRRNPARPDFAVTTGRVPVLTFSHDADYTWTLLLVLDPPVPFRDIVRPGVLAMRVAAIPARVYFAAVPGTRTVARGIVCEPTDLPHALATFTAAGYTVAGPPVVPSDAQWLRGG